jgi:phosphatidylglycerol:prolipoprotein diacylglycerol transferase
MIELYGFFIFLGIIFVYSLNDLYFKKFIFVNNIDLNNILIYIYISAFLGGKIIYILLDNLFIYEIFSFDCLFGGFSLLGASFFGLIGLTYYINKKNLENSLTSFLPITLLFLHSFGRIGCYFSGCCDGLFKGVSLHFIVILFFLFLGFIGLLLNYYNKILSFYSGLYYYIFVVFLERFLFDYFRFDYILFNLFFTKYQIVSIFYLLLSVFVIFIFSKKL